MSINDGDIPAWPYCLNYADMMPKHEPRETSGSNVTSKPVVDKKRDRSRKISELEIQFLGTVSSQPTPTRAHTSLAVRLDGEVWIFDAGESCQLQLSKSSLKGGKVTTIFITHLHGDHVFGLAPLVSSLAQSFRSAIDVDAAPVKKISSMDDAPVQLEIYGPHGTRAYLRNALRLSYTFTTSRWRVHELILPGEQENDLFSGPPHPCEVVGQNIRSSNEDGRILFRDFLVHDEHRPKYDFVSVSAAPIRHTIPTLGFVLQECDLQGNVSLSAVELIKESGLPLSILKTLKAGRTIRLPNGTVLQPPASVPGRKVCILGDTCDPSNIAELAKDADVLIHEATNAHLRTTQDEKASDTYESVQLTTISHGHSTPQMAGSFARSINATSLLLNHFSGRYKGNSDEESVRVMNEIRDLAKSEFPDREVFTARDWSSFMLSASKTLKYRGICSKHSS